MHLQFLKADQMIFEKFNPEKHDSFKVANLIYDVDFRTFDMFFKDSNQAVKAIHKYLIKDESDDNFQIILKDNEVIGLVIFFVNESPSFKYNLLKLTSFSGLKLFIMDILDYFVLCDVENGDLHVAELAIDSSQRGKGLGSQVLFKIIEYGRKNNFKRITLDADFRNTKAKSLYEKIGFKTFNKKRVKIFGFERGMSNMEFKL